jgi:hypothetical protein
MNKIKRQSIANTITSAKVRCEKAFSSYRPYMPTLDHEAALKELEEAKQFIIEAQEKIKNEVTV